MKFCTHCGNQVQEGLKFCPSCGNAIEGAQMQQPVQPQMNNNNAQGMDMSEKGIAVLAYIIPLIPYLMKPKTEFGKFHAAQGFNLWLINIIVSVVRGVLSNYIPTAIYLALGVIPALIGVLQIIGLVWAAQGKKEELPVLGSIKIVK